MDVRLDGKVTLVTGGGGGFGRAYSMALAASGADVAVADLDLAAAQTTVAAIESAGGRARAYRVDLREAAAVKAMLAAVLADFGLARAVDDFLAAERDAVAENIAELGRHAPFRKSP